MNIRWKIFLGLSVITIALLTFTYVISNYIILSSFYEIEDSAITKSVEQAYDGVGSILTQMEVKIADWASWDDTYDYVSDQNEEYEELNLNEQALDALKVDIVIVLDNNSNIVGSFSVDPESGSEKPLPSDLLQHISLGDPVVTHASIEDTHKGFLMLNDGPLAFVASPILTNSGEGPSRGTLIFGKFFDGKTEKSVEELTHLYINTFRYDDKQNVPDDIKNTDVITIKRISNNQISGYITVNDFYRNPIMILEVVESRPIFKQAQTTLLYFLVSMLGTGLILVFSSVYFINHFLVNRIYKISAILKIGDPISDKLLTIKEKGRDEIAALATSINGMFDKIRAFSDQIMKLLSQIRTEKENVEKVVQLRTAELLDEKARVIASIEGVEGAFILFDKDKNVILTNKMVSEILGDCIGNWTMGSIQKKLGNIIDVSKEIDSSIKDKDKILLKSKSFGSKFIDIFMTPIFVENSQNDSNDKYVGSLLLIRDITEEKILDRSKDEFFSIASHELRTPLTVIRGNMSIAMDYYRNELKDENLLNLIQDTHKSSVRLINIVNDFLNMSRLEQGRIDFKEERFDLVALAKKVINDLKNKASEKGIRLSVSDLSLMECFVKADEGRLEQVIVNLVANAINYTDEGEVIIDISVSDNNAIIIVSDTGKGIPDSQQSLLFRKFQQAGESLYTRDSYGGTGLGLYISKMLIEGMGGKIGLSYSEEGKGSSFTISLPVA